MSGRRTAALRKSESGARDGCWETAVLGALKGCVLRERRLGIVLVLALARHRSVADISRWYAPAWAPSICDRHADSGGHQVGIGCRLSQDEILVIQNGDYDLRSGLILYVIDGSTSAQPGDRRDSHPHRHRECLWTVVQVMIWILCAISRHVKWLY